MSSEKPRNPDNPVTPPGSSDLPTEEYDPPPHPAPGPEPDPLLGKTLSQYRITKRLGQGGMGVVYKADDTRLHRSVALKFLAPQLLAEPQAKQRFLREARAAAALDDPHICTVHDICEVGGHTFIVMNYVEGESLKERLARKRPALNEALEIARQTAQGLASAHRRGMVHRDIKPGNILLTKDGQVKIADFGLAKLAADTRLTRTGAAVGTLAYMSPEQTRGREVDRRADIWSLGVVLYEMLTGELPFRGDNEQAMTRAILKSAPKPVSDFRPEVSLELEEIVEKSISKRPGKRYPEVDAFLADIQEQIRTLELRKRPGRLVALRRFLRRRSTRRAFTAAALVAVAAAAFYIVPRVLPPRAIPRIMVARWENGSSRPGLDWASGALMSGLIQTLGDLKDYNVISRQTVAATVDALQLASVAPIPYGTAQEVGASYLVSGSFRREGAWLVLDCELTNVAREGVVVDTWSVELADSARIQEAVVELAVNVAGALHASWTQDPRTAPSTRPTASTAALKHYQRGLDHEERHEYAEAVVEFFKAVKDDSTFAEAHFGIARLTMEKDVEQKHYTLAMKYRLRAPPLTRKIIEAQGLVWDNQLDPAIEKFEEILREDPEQVTARKELAQLYSARRRFSEAFAEYAVLHEISPLDYSFYQSWSVAAVLNGKPDQAVALLGDWRRRFPEQEQPFVAYLSLCYQLSRIGEGTALCDSVAGIDPETLPFACGWLYERAGRLNEAEAIFSRLVASPDPGLPSTRGNAYMAWLSYRRQEYVRGLGYIDNALEKWDNTWYRWLAGSLAAGAGRIDEAREHARAILRLDPQSADTTVAGAMGNQRWYFDLLGLIDLAEGRPRDAAAEFRKALRFSTVFDDPEYRTHLGRAYLEAGDLDAAARELATVWTATPTFPQAWLYLGKTYVEQGDYENAMEVLRNLEDLWRRADADDPLNLELERLMDLASNR